MSDTSYLDSQGYINFPRQKLSDAQKTDKWYKRNIDFAENLLTSDVNLRNSFKNKRINYNLRANVISPRDFERYINPDNLDLDTLPASFQHIGIENTKINLLLGEYAKRKKEFKAYISSGDQEGISRKEEMLMDQVTQEMVQIIQTESISPEEIQKRLQDLEKYQNYGFQDMSEIVANKILKKEYKEGNFDFTFLRTFEDLLTAGEEIMYCGVLGGEPVMRRVNPMNVYTLGGNSMFIEDADIIVEYGYKSVGQVIDDYWDTLTPKDVDFLETGKLDTNMETGGGIGLNRDTSIFDFYGEAGALDIFHPNEAGVRTFAGAFDTYGNVRVMKVCWRSRRKIGELTYFDDEGVEQKDWVPEDYRPDKELGEKVKWIWVNEWMEGTKIADHIYTVMRPLPFASKSLVNKSKGTPPYIGSVNSTNDYKVQSLMDIMKPLAYSYDIAYYKRELEIATYKGSFTAINSALVPSGWDPKEWMRYVTVNKFAWLDPTNEILKGPSQGKSAGQFNQLTAQQVNIGDPNAIGMYTNLLVDIENTLGKLAGVTGAREGQIQNREAVNNVEREVAQTSHITEKWFAIDQNFRKRVLTKFLECCKYAYKENPQKGQFLLDDMSQQFITHFDEFASTEYDLHLSNSTSDTQLYNDIKALSQAAIQNGQATISDLVAISQSDSVQDIAKKLEASAKRIKEENNKMQEQQMKQQQEMQQAQMQADKEAQEIDIKKHDDDIAVKREKIQAELEIAAMREMNNNYRTESGLMDSDSNGIADELDLRRTEIEEKRNDQQADLNQAKLDEQVRSNQAKEQIAIQKMDVEEARTRALKKK
tara:strand:- start:2793 stop:5249 length:2457 start_codon:yes stop_codon:yes gene_type:complete